MHILRRIMHDWGYLIFIFFINLISKYGCPANSFSFLSKKQSFYPRIF
jgi:hypothetical protein